jgi:hypothetical protein
MKILKRFGFFIAFIITIGILMIPVIISMIIWIFTGKGIFWIVKLLDWMFSTQTLNDKES